MHHLQTQITHVCVSTCKLVHGVACSLTCGYTRARLYLHMRIHWLSPPLLLQGYPPHPHNASYQPLMPRRCAHTHCRSVPPSCLNLPYCTFPLLKKIPFCPEAYEASLQRSLFTNNDVSYECN